MSSGGNQKSEKLRSESRVSDTESFHSQYVVLKTIGRGGFAEVKLAKHRLTGTLVAVKMIHKTEHRCDLYRSELNIMTRINHPNIISLLQVIETEKRMYLIMELAEGKELYKHIREAGHLEEDEARGIFRQLLSAVRYCHDQGIIHRDLKPDNIMVDSKGRVKIIDFGLGTQVKPGQKLNYYCGTYPFAAPELLLRRQYDGPKVDVWTLGVTLYVMTVGRVPFDAANTPDLRRQVVSGKYPVPDYMSEELQDLLHLFLTVNPKHRPTIADLMSHPWLQKDSEEFPDPCVEPIPLKPDPAIIKAMKHIGFDAQDIKDSLDQKKYNQTMASYCLLRGQALQRCDSPTRAQPMNPWITPFPSLDDPATFPLGLRRRVSQPIQPLSSSSSQGSAYGQKSRQRGRVSWPGVLSCEPLQTTPSLGQPHKLYRSLPCVSSIRWRGKKTSSKDREDKSRASAEDQPVPSTERPRRFKGWTRKIGNALRKLCCCIPTNMAPHLGQNRVIPQK